MSYAGRTSFRTSFFLTLIVAATLGCGSSREDWIQEGSLPVSGAAGAMTMPLNGAAGAATMPLNGAAGAATMPLNGAAGAATVTMPTPTGMLTSAGTFGEAVVMGGSGSTADRYHKADVTRDGANYFLMANGWGPGFDSQTLSWLGTSFTVESMTGTQGENWEPASYPTVFCGNYSDSRSFECGLPAALAELTSLRTGWSWSANGNIGEYNAAYDVWLGNGSSFSSYFMVWLRDPPGQQPAGGLTTRSVTVPNVPGTWNIWVGTVNNAPIVNFVRAEGADSEALEFDLLDFFAYSEANGITIPGTHVLSVAVGFELWNGPVTNLKSLDFYVNPQ